MGKMIKPIAFETEEISYACDFGRTYKTEEILSTAFALDGQKIQIFVNFQKQEKTIIFNGEEMVIPALSVCKKSI